MEVLPEYSGLNITSLILGRIKACENQLHEAKMFPFLGVTWPQCVGARL